MDIKDVLSESINRIIVQSKEYRTSDSSALNDGIRMGMYFALNIIKNDISVYMDEKVLSDIGLNFRLEELI